VIYLAKTTDNIWQSAAPPLLIRTHSLFPSQRNSFSKLKSLIMVRDLGYLAFGLSLAFSIFFWVIINFNTIKVKTKERQSIHYVQHDVRNSLNQLGIIFFAMILFLQNVFPWMQFLLASDGAFSLMEQVCFWTSAEGIIRLLQFSYYNNRCYVVI